MHPWSWVTGNPMYLKWKGICNNRITYTKVINIYMSQGTNSPSDSQEGCSEITATLIHIQCCTLTKFWRGTQWCQVAALQTSWKSMPLINDCTALFKVLGPKLNSSPTLIHKKAWWVRIYHLVLTLLVFNKWIRMKTENNKIQMN